MKLYGRPNEEGVLFPVSWWKDQAYDAGKPVIIEGMKREIGGEMMWCDYEGEFVYSTEVCGRSCPNYCPCNGKSGRCTELKQGYIGTGIFYRITEKGSVRRAIK